jgi:hypothetical protein
MTALKDNLFVKSEATFSDSLHEPGAEWKIEGAAHARDQRRWSNEQLEIQQFLKSNLVTRLEAIDFDDTIAGRLD